MSYAAKRAKLAADLRSAIRMSKLVLIVTDPAVEADVPLLNKLTPPFPYQEYHLQKHQL